jgi:hypothetical protein
MRDSQDPAEMETGLMSQGTDSQASEIEATKASAHLPGLDIDVIHRQSPGGDWEQVSINLRAAPSFEALGRSFDMTDPFTLWTQAARLMWMPWLLAAQTMGLPDSRPRALPNARSQQGCRLPAIDEAARFTAHDHSLLWPWS